jgi:hypothetical protein
MTALLDRALEAARSLSSEAQDGIARIVPRLAGADDEAPVPLTPDEEEAIAASKTAAARSEFATDEQVRLRGLSTVDHTKAITNKAPLGRA